MNTVVKEKQVNVQELMAEIRAKVEASQGGNSGRFTAAKPSHSDAPVHSEELSYLNAHWSDWSQSPSITSHRKFFGPIIVKLKSKLVHLFWKYLLKDYFERERQFQMNLVRYLNNQAKYNDKRFGDLFWDVIKKVDADVEGLNERIDLANDNLSIETERAFRTRDEHRLDLEQQQVHIVSELASLRDLVKGIESILASATSSSKLEDSDPLEYLLLENRFRGSRELIGERNTSYLELFKGASKPIVDIGCGRGEFLAACKESNVKAIGIDFDQSMIDTCTSLGFDAKCSDAIKFLSEADENSFSGVIATQVVEHLSAANVSNLISEARRSLDAGGVLVLETINPTSVVALSSNFYKDPTHIKPIHPETLKFQLEVAGFSNVEIVYKSEFPDTAKLQKIQLGSKLPASSMHLVEHVNATIEQLNGILFGFQDFAVVGTK